MKAVLWSPIIQLMHSTNKFAYLALALATLARTNRPV